ncbi:hypothetical protein C0583_00500 [Candidatus Parcubacteria bacterium]|nr:MAG: hypothetical protein C0583_00500 [Candidatus Parcubacteria bacterium]
MKKNSTFLGIGALSLLLVAGVAFSASAYQGNYSVQGPNYSEDRDEIMTEAFETENYASWSEQMNGRGRVTEVVNADNFAKFAKAHELGKAGHTEEADSLRAELGLRTSNGESLGMGYRGGNGGRGQGQGGGQGQGSRGASYVDSNGDGLCDNLN